MAYNAHRVTPSFTEAWSLGAVYYYRICGLNVTLHNSYAMFSCQEQAAGRTTQEEQEKVTMMMILGTVLATAALGGDMIQ